MSRESVTMQTVDPAGRTFSPSSAAVYSIRLFVVSGWPPESSTGAASPSTRIAAQPPGPGLRRHAPSVQMSTSPGRASTGVSTRRGRERRREGAATARHDAPPFGCAPGRAPRPAGARRPGILSRMSDLNGKVALVTGASGGIGAATAEALHGAGAKVGLLSRRGDDLGLDGARGVACDVRDRDAVFAAVGEVVDAFGGLDVVVANAGVGAYGSFLDLDPDDVERMIDINLKGTLHTAAATLPHLIERGGGDFVALASVAGVRAFPGEAVYNASKYGQIGFIPRSTTSCGRRESAAPRSRPAAWPRGSRSARAARRARRSSRG